MRGTDGLHPALAYYVEQANEIVGEQAPGLSLWITSGYRSTERQAQLLASWNAGNRAGLIARPAARSRHSEGRAVDLAFVWRGARVAVADTPRDYFEFLADLFAPVGGTWGGSFRSPDINHYEWRFLSA